MKISLDTDQFNSTQHSFIIDSIGCCCRGLAQPRTGLAVNNEIRQKTAVLVEDEAG